MTTQSIFKGFGSNWKWASRTAGGIARLHTILPTITTDGVLAYNRNRSNCVRCEAFDHREVPQDAACVIWERTDFANGPDYATDAFGLALYEDEADTPVVVDAVRARRGDCAEDGCENERGVFGQYCQFAPSMPVAPPPPPAPTQTRLTTDEAENGMLWAFARSYEDRVHVDSLGGVYFDIEAQGVGAGRFAMDVHVDGVISPITRTRSTPHPAPAMPVGYAEPIADRNPQALPVEEHTALLQAEVIKHANWGHNPEGYSEYDKGIANGLELAIALINKRSPNFAHTPMQHEPAPAVLKAKAHAKHLMRQANVDGSEQLTAVQYMAIFGELPE
jgi:hypothetical protein